MSVEVIIEGNIGGLELKVIRPNTADEKNLLSFSVASTDRKKITDEQGNVSYQDDPTAWHQIEYWNPNAKHLSTLLEKGMTVCVHGQQRQSSFLDSQTGEQRIKTITIASRIYLVPTARIEKIKMFPKKPQTDNSQNEA